MFRMGKKDENLATSKIQAAFDFPQVLGPSLPYGRTFVIDCGAVPHVTFWFCNWSFSKGKEKYILDRMMAVDLEHLFISPAKV